MDHFDSEKLRWVDYWLKWMKLSLEISIDQVVNLEKFSSFYCMGNTKQNKPLLPHSHQCLLVVFSNVPAFSDWEGERNLPMRGNCCQLSYSNWFLKTKSIVLRRFGQKVSIWYLTIHIFWFLFCGSCLVVCSYVLSFFRCCLFLLLSFSDVKKTIVFRF